MHVRKKKIHHFLNMDQKKLTQMNEELVLENFLLFQLILGEVFFAIRPAGLYVLSPIIGN